ncbi:hypothetical protein LI328DRAFT_24874 [Trichoderma asperelloides]|nr:hypothetical protein LI328DRAFT_24874 [Trichoderma asperelloides]
MPQIKTRLRLRPVPTTSRASQRRRRSRITSHQKRRQAIREGFDRLTELVPGLQGQGRSEGLVLKRTVDYMREQLVQRQALIDRVEQAGGDVDPKFKKVTHLSRQGPNSR